MLVPIFPCRALKALYLIVMLVIEFVCVAGENATSNSSEESKKSRIKRYLVYPTPGTFAPTKLQLIIGLGLPMEVDVSMIVGYVMKFNYVLPYNASYLTHPYTAKQEEERRREGIFSIVSKGTTVERNAGIAIAEQAEEERRGSRWQIYRIIESALDSFQVSGKGCLLKTVCQVAQVPFENSRAGLVAQLIHLLLTPSMSWEKYQVSGDQEYHSAEVAGRENPEKCETLFPECRHNLLEYFTEINEQLVEPSDFSSKLSLT